MSLLRVNVEGLSTNDVFIKKIIFSFSYFTFFVLFGYGVNYLLLGNTLLGVIEAILGLLQLLNIYLLNKKNNILFASFFLVFSVDFMSLVIFTTGGLGNTGFLWILVVPFFTMLVLNTLQATIWIIGYMLIIFLIIVAHLYEIYTLQYDFITIRQTIVVFIIILILIYYNEKYKNQIRFDIEEKNQQLQKVVKIDGLTGIANRDYINEFLSKEMSRSNRFENPLSIIMIDIDYFKLINDNHGHLVGDNVLIEFSKTLKNNIREADLVGRWGGEEFLIICPDTPLESAIAMAKKLQEKIKYIDTETQIQLTASFGVVEYQFDYSIDDLINRADEYMYRAKKLGRDRIVYT